jgi:hypothetical protein
MMSVGMKRVYEIAKTMDESLRSDEPRFGHCVMILHEEGTTLFYRNAYIVKYYDPENTDSKNLSDCESPGEWIMVFTEHHGFHVYPKDDLRGFQELQIVESERFHANIEEMLVYEKNNEP